MKLLRRQKKFAKSIKNGEISLDDINEDYFEKHLMTKDLPPVDLMVRSSGECRLSNFLPWQLAYAEFIFDETLWLILMRNIFIGQLQYIREGNVDLEV